jgi:hypothetical protein
MQDVTTFPCQYVVNPQGVQLCGKTPTHPTLISLGTWESSPGGVQTGEVVQAFLCDEHRDAYIALREGAQEA